MEVLAAEFPDIFQQFMSASPLTREQEEDSRWSETDLELFNREQQEPHDLEQLLCGGEISQ